MSCNLVFEPVSQTAPVLMFRAIRLLRPVLCYNTGFCFHWRPHIFVRALAGVGLEDIFLTLCRCLDTSKSCDLACEPISQTTAPVLMCHMTRLLINENHFKIK